MSTTAIKLTDDQLDSRLRASIRKAFRVINQQVPVVIGDTVGMDGEEGGHFTIFENPHQAPGRVRL